VDLELSSEQQALRDAAREFAEGELAPHAADWDEKKLFPVDTLRAAAALGFAGTLPTSPSTTWSPG
jgi:alkylation response protein AidB-like acyl-CoA dehydrogenase